MFSQTNQIEKSLQTSYFSLGKPISEITTQNSTPSIYHTNLSIQTKKKIQAQSKVRALDFSQCHPKTPSTPSSKAYPATPSLISSATKKRKINRKLPVPPKPDPSVTSEITKTISKLSLERPNVNDFLLLNAKVNKLASSEIRDTNKILSKLLAKFQNLPEAKNCRFKSGVTREDLAEVVQVEKKFKAMNSLTFEDPAQQLQKMMTAAQNLFQEQEMIDQDVSSEFQSEQANYAQVKNFTAVAPGIRRKIKKNAPVISHKSSKSNALARRSTFETSRGKMSQDLVVENGSGISLGYSLEASKQDLGKGSPSKTAPAQAPIIRDSEIKAQKAPKARKVKNYAKVDVNSMFGFSEAEDEARNFRDEAAEDDKRNWDKFGFLFCQSDDSDKFSVNGSASEEFHCAFNISQGFPHGAGGNGPANGLQGLGSGNVNAQSLSMVANNDDFGGWLERPNSYGPMSVTFSACGGMSPCLGIEHGGFDENCMEFR
jgi:hypothetical protein